MDLSRAGAKKIAAKALKKTGLYGPVYRAYIRIRLGKQESYFFDMFIHTVRNKSVAYQNKTVLFYGFMLTERKKVIYEIMDKLVEQKPELNILVLQNALRLRKNEKILRDTMIPADVLLFPEYGRREIEIGLLPPLTADKEKVVKEKYYLREAVENLSEMLPGTSVNLLKSLAYEYYRAYSAVLDNINVSTVVIWNKFHACHYIFSELCKERNVRVVYAEFGSLPGTIVLDEKGQMGESWPATHPDEFLELPVTEEECAQAEKMIEVLRNSGLNRNVQPENDDNDALQKQLKPGRPIILYAGQYDADSGMIPYTENTRTYHSPCFKSSEEGMTYVAEIAKRHDWNFIYKPHPLVKNKISVKRLPENVIFIPDYNINSIIDLADVVITILSTTVYVSLIRETAALMLGYNQISRKGCVYEAFKKEDVEPALISAVEKGYTSEQKHAFIQHVAQMSKYYLYSDGQKRADLSLGRPVQRALEFIVKGSVDCAEMLEREENACVLCDSLASFLFAVQMQAVRPEWHPTLIMADADYLRPLLDEEVHKRYFSSVRWVTSDEVAGVAASAKLFADFTDVYVPDGGAKGLQVLESLLQIESSVSRFHFYDDGLSAGLLTERANDLEETLEKQGKTEHAPLCELISCNVKQCAKGDNYTLRQIGNCWKGAQVQELLSPEGREQLHLLCLAGEAGFPTPRLLNIAQEFDDRC